MRPHARSPRLPLALALAACGPSTPVPVPDLATTTFAPSLGVDLARRPCSPTASTCAICRGNRARRSRRGQLSVHYTGWLADGTRFDSNEGGAAFSFRYGAGEVITGWDQGLDGVLVGGSGSS